MAQKSRRLTDCNLTCCSGFRDPCNHFQAVCCCYREVRYRNRLPCCRSRQVCNASRQVCSCCREVCNASRQVCNPNRLPCCCSRQVCNASRHLCNAFQVDVELARHNNFGSSSGFALLNPTYIAKPQNHNCYIPKYSFSVFKPAQRPIFNKPLQYYQPRFCTPPDGISNPQGYLREITSPKSASP